MILRFEAWLGTLPEPVGVGATGVDAIADALREMRKQGFIGPEDHQFPDEMAASVALSVRPVDHLRHYPETT